MKVYISTNSEQPANCFEGRIEKAQVSQLVASLAENDKIEIAPNVFLIKDSLENITIEDIDNCILLYHSSTKNVVKNAFKIKPENPGMHEQNDNYLYAPVFRILLNPNIPDNEKAIEIIKKLGLTKEKLEERDSLESKLNFLHHCLTPDGLTNDEVAKSEWANTVEFKELEKVTDGPFGAKYLEALSKLRDALLS